MIACQIHSSLTHKVRRYELVPSPNCGVVEAVLTIRLGEVGQRGGVSKIRNEVYFLQEPVNDPDVPAKMGRTFWLAKTSGKPANVASIPDDPEECIYECFVPPRGGEGYCTCKGHQTRGCKHADSLEHLVNVVGIGHGFVQDTPERIKCCGLADCDICNGTGWVEVESVSEWGIWT